MGGGIVRGGNDFISFSSLASRVGLLGLGLEDRLVGALDPLSDSVLEVLPDVVLDPVLDAVFLLPLEARAWAVIISIASS
jgi:hypothetical protein